MTQLWAIVDKDETYCLIYTDGLEQHPENHGHEEDCLGKTVMPLSRDLDSNHGEVISFSEKKIVFDAEKAKEMLFPEVKQEAFRRIESRVPLWRQINDLNSPDDSEVIERRNYIQSVRDWSTEIERRILAASSAEEVREIMKEVRER